MIIPHRNLSPEALSGVVEEYVTRSGTEYTDMSVKMASVMRCLDRGDLVLVYDAETDSCNIVQPDEAAHLEDNEPNNTDGVRS